MGTVFNDERIILDIPECKAMIKDFKMRDIL